ncbi:hypothetical protein F5X68DRAFT_259213 [Plectosphaerella plurivora]|uniref:Uncharacterized protein n=1 Tax=Plectosphaerella plurivora TaxID=936078 RepID=A0A9P8VJ04_9PEZI|nr:hypothetical protein F5X68DRAFT_259213 [Plectosphaerella plurivora]
MEVDQDEEQLRALAAGLPMDYAQWPTLLSGIITRLDKIARHDFPIPTLPPPPRPVDPPGTMAPPSSSIAAIDSQSSSQEADKENARPATETDGPVQDQTTTSPAPGAAEDATRAPAPATPQQLAPGDLPPQIQDMLTEITTVLRDSFPRHPPHTIQRLAELILAPRAHYRHLAPYLHAVDRIVHITSISSVYPLPPAIPDMSTMTLLSNGVSDHSRAHANANADASPPEKDPAAAVAWSNPTSSVGSDEALGGALLTPIPWLTRRPSPHAGSATSSPGSKSPQHQQQQPTTAAASAAAAAAAQHEIRTESTETIDGPNGMGSIETVTVNLNGPSIMTAGSAAAIAAQQQAQREAQAAAAAIAAGNTGSRPITQGELLRQEQQRGVVPISQLARHAEEVASHHTQNAAAQVAAAQTAAVAAAVGRSGPGAPRAAAPEEAAGDGDEDAGDVADREAGPVNDETAEAASADDDKAAEADEDEVPHARGPEEIGVGDLGPQSKSTMTFIGGAHPEMQGIDIEAAVGRKSDETEKEEAKEETKEETTEAAAPDHETASDAGSETSKREADTELPEGAPVKRPRASASPDSQDAVMTERPAGEEVKADGA